MPATRTGTVGERLTAVEARLNALQESTALHATQVLEGQSRLAASQTALARTVADAGTAQAVLAQWMRDWTTEVNAWRTAMEQRPKACETQQERAERDVAHARGALRVAMWTFGTALTIVTGALTGITARVLGELVGRAGP